MQNLMEFIENLSVAPAVAHGRLEVIPVLSLSDRPSRWLSLEEALANGQIEITEISDRGSVPKLRVTNRGEKDVLIVDGAQLVGAKQNRIANTTIIVAAQSETEIPVSCVEQGRWGYRSRSFAQADAYAPASLRRDKFANVTQRLRSHGRFDADQSMVWDAIARKSGRLGVTSPTGAMEDIFSEHKVAFEELQTHFQPLPKQVGLLCFIRGGFAGGDLFGSPDLLHREFLKLLRSYWLDFIDRAVSFRPLGTDELFAQLRAAKLETYKSVGRGREVRFESTDLQGSWTVVDDEPVHLTVLPRWRESVN